MNRLLNCQKIRHVLSLSLLISLYTFSSAAAEEATKNVAQANSVEGVVEQLGPHENAYEIKLKGDKRYFNISNAGAMKPGEIARLRKSLENKSTVRLKLKDREVIAVENVPGAGKPAVGGDAPGFTVRTHEDKEFKLVDRKGKWTVLYFYPKAETPGCTKQACAFRDSIKVITALNADVFGVSADSVKDQAAFHKNHSLTFTLLADPDAKVIEKYGTKMPVMKMSKRWTFIISPDLKIAHIDEGVDPVKDAGNVAKKLKELQAAK